MAPRGTTVAPLAPLSLASDLWRLVGRSGTKVAFIAPGTSGVSTLLIPSAFAPAGTISDDVAAAAAKADTVEVGGKLWWVGDTALLQARDEMVGGLDDKWVQGAKHEALLKAALKRVEGAGVDVRGETVVVGLPSRGFANNRAAYQARAKEIAPACSIRVYPQSLGPYYNLVFDDAGSEQKGFTEKSVAVIEIGQYTTDLARIDAGVSIESALDSTDGMRIAAEALARAVARDHNVTLGLAEATTALVTGKFKNFGRDQDVTALAQDAVKPLADKIADKVTQVFGADLRTVDKIIVAGGGAPLLRAQLLQRLPGAQIADDARFAVARGFLRVGLAAEALDAARRSKPEAVAA